LPLKDAILGGSPMIEQVILTGQAGRRLVAILVLNPKEVMEEGFLKTKDGA
jgi:long-subunit acyl-CoA synthetase (AMP-forming)